MTIRNILVTGGAGYIGSHLVDALVGRDYTVTVLDNLEPQVHRSGAWPSYANPKATYVKGDVRDRSVFEPLVLASQAVVHFGAAVSVGQSMYQVDRYVDVNTRGTALLLDILVNTKHKVEKVLVASSIGVYGEGAYECATHGQVAPTIRPEAQLAIRDWEQHCPHCGAHVRSVPTPEGKALYRDNIYSMTKYHQEEMVLLIGKTYGIPSVAPRFFNVYGPRQSLSNPYAGVAAIWLSRLLNGKQPIVFEDGGQLRDFVSIHDVVDCLVLMLEQPGADYLPVNVGSGRTITILEIATLLARLLGSPIEPQVTQTGRKFDIRHNTADITRAQQTLGFAPKVTLDEGFSELIEWAKTTPDVAVDFFDKALQELQDKGLLVKS
ncbi:MAG TPA: NAD-dependent epimerase/dehydratase family protein [Vicinamibacterales bacterium]|nr:NAD-dependent epimerase/dehydratase family protein [Vicinamibacterales bacterium]